MHSEITPMQFESFLTLYRSRLEDEDINIMLFFLDDGYYYDRTLKQDIGINDFLFALKNPDVYNVTSLRNGRSKILERVMLGFTKYMNYLVEYQSILEKYENSTYQVSTLWLLESYWFVRLNEKLGSVLQQSLLNLSDAIQQDCRLQWGDEELDEDLIQAWRQQSAEIWGSTEKAINQLKNPNLGEPIYSIVRHYLGNEYDRSGF